MPQNPPMRKRLVDAVGLLLVAIGSFIVVLARQSGRCERELNCLSFPAIYIATKLTRGLGQRKDLQCMSSRGEGVSSWIIDTCACAALYF